MAVEVKQRNALRRCLVVLLVGTFAGTASVAQQSDGVRTLEWDDLLPPSYVLAPPIVDHSSVPPFNDFAPAPAPTVASLDGALVRLPGFVVPLDVSEGKVSSFLLVPYFGACIHQPPPPSNQIVHVSFAEPVELESMYAPVWVTGRIRVETYSSLMADAGYALAGQVVEPYEY